ncbi:immunity 49 family protein [Streptomyces sp. LHD-70]|uniref:immunity 49 family protein n=1 Tax=Streptomyces sp. LHD-70 TaxID=3072140 RepID=UPI00280D7AB7|nr:immunity 49 family protein [Streptomyces sp. LHD-70]MDQ8705185.1 immunity 49 family protein [Streptomyces sp. LHD-70]
MAVQDVSRHEVDERLMARALDGIKDRTLNHWYGLRYGSPSLRNVAVLRDELLDHVAASVQDDGSLAGPWRRVLETAAECALGILSVGCYPDGDQEIRLPLLGEEISTDDDEVEFGDLMVSQAPTTATWVEAFSLCLVSGLILEWRRVIGPLLQDEYAGEIRSGVPYSELESRSEPAGLAEMDALSLYLAPATGHRPSDWPRVPLREPTAEERVAAAGQLDASGPLSPDQQLLRVLLDDDQQAFEQALAARLVRHRESVGSDPAPRSLLPLGALAPAALAVQVHGWELGVSSGYLPYDLLRSSQAPGGSGS